MHWIYLILAGLFETFWAIELKQSQGFTRPLESVLTVGGMIISFTFLSLALKQLPLNMAYAIWSGIGIIGTFFAGIFLFKDQMSAIQIVFVCLILTGIVGLKLISGK